jgi:hypothetical protein
MDMELENYYAVKAYRTKTARNHVSFAGVPGAGNRMMAKYAEPLSAYAENNSRLFISCQADYLELRDDWEGLLLY